LPATLPPGATSKQSSDVKGCLAQAGLMHPRLTHGQDWTGQAPKTHDSVFVDGPYKSAAAAEASAKSLQAIEYATQGGLFVASEPLRSRLDEQVKTVAAC